MKRQSVSVCMTSYNGEKFIEEQLRSILPQLLPDDEVIVSDDGSSDRTKEIINSINDSRIIVIDGPKKGFASNFLYAVGKAKNEIVILSDQDDIWADDKVEKVLSVFASDPECTTVLHDMYTFHDSIEEKGEEIQVAYKKGFAKNVLYSSYWGSCMAFRRGFIMQFLPVNDKCLAHDQLMGLASEKHGKTVFIKEKLIYRRLHSGNITSSKRKIKDKIRFRAELFSEYEELEEGYYKKTAPAANESVFSKRLRNIAIILILAFFADCCIFGAGRVIDFGYVSFRMIIMALAFIASLPFVIKEGTA